MPLSTNNCAITFFFCTSGHYSNETRLYNQLPMIIYANEFCNLIFTVKRQFFITTQCIMANSYHALSLKSYS